MKKANLHNFLIIAIIFSLFYILNIILTQNNIDITFDIEIQSGIKEIIIIGIFLLLMIPSVLYSSRMVFNLFIKHIRTTKLNYSRYSLIITSLFTSYVFLLFDVEVYYYFGSILILYLVYFSSLYLYDIRFVKKQQETKVTVSDELVEKFLQLLGGKDNIISVSYEHSRLKVELNNINLIDVQEIKNLGASGIFIAGNKLQAIIGNNAYELEKALKGYLSQV